MKKFLLYTMAVFALMQLIPIDRTVQAADPGDALQTTPEIKTVLKRACYDCHSNETNYPAYSYVAPLSWVISSNIRNGREALNFSTWKSMDAKIKAMRMERFEKVLKLGMMPKPEYLLLHEDAKLSREDVMMLSEWVKGLKKESPAL